MNNDKLEQLKKGLENFSVEQFKEEEEKKETIDLSSLWTDIDLSGSAANITTAASYGSFNINSTSPYTFSTGANGFASNVISHNSPGTLQVKGDAEFDGDVKIKGKSMVEMLKGIEDRLAILVPDPAKLEHFEALKKAYDHYKTLEALCQVPNKEEK